jgi:hypothetical protein
MFEEYKENVDVNPLANTRQNIDSKGGQMRIGYDD